VEHLVDVLADLVGVLVGVDPGSVEPSGVVVRQRGGIDPRSVAPRLLFVSLLFLVLWFSFSD
jgi:hypothetical protein